MGCLPKFNNVDMMSAFGDSKFMHGILHVRFTDTPKNVSILPTVYKWVDKTIKGAAVVFTNSAGSIYSEEGRIPRAILNVGEGKLMDMLEHVFAGEDMQNGDEFAVVFMHDAIDMAALQRFAMTERPVVLITTDHVHTGDHRSRFLSRYALEVNPAGDHLIVRNQSGQSGITFNLKLD